MPELTKQATITIDGTAIADYQSLTVTQSLHTYHHFELAFRYDELEGAVAFNPSKRESLVGGKFVLTIKGEDSSMAKLTFNGIVAEAEVWQPDKDLRGSLVVRGYGQPYELDTVPGISAYYEVTAQDLVTKCLSGYTGEKDVKAPAGPTHTLPFAVRYRETYWNFLRRIAYDYGAWLYYDGVKLHFTAVPGTDPVELTLGLNVHGLRAGTRTAPQFVHHYDYLSLNDTVTAAEGTANAAPFGTVDESPQPAPRRAIAAADVAKFATNRSASHAAAGAGYASGISDVPGLSVGTTVRLKDPKGEESLGDFIVVEVTHRMNEKKEYRGHFQAIAADVTAMPPGPLHRPVAEPQVATVKDNKDPQKLGRVQVNLHWMKASEKTPWLRVLAPHYGLDGKQKKSRGLLFVPEIEDQVLVGFQHGDPERPFVFGAMPHGKNAAVPDPAVSEHHISVKSGSTVTFLDTDTAHELHVQVDDKNLLTIVVDNGQGTITLNASKAIILKATQELTLDAPKIAIKGKEIAITGDVKTAIAAKTVEVKADIELKASGAMVKIAGTGQAAFESSGITVVKGSLVQIN